jgi:uncharacterized damage-inducible protein DinB
MGDDLFSLFTYNRWANDRVVESVRTLTPEQYAQEPTPGWSSVRSTLVHIAEVTLVWARGLRGEGFAFRTEAEVPTLDEVVPILAQGQEAFEQLLSRQTPETLAAIWTTTDPRGVERRLPYWTVYRHVVNHATYHRGQIASKLGRFGIALPKTDLGWWAVEQTAQ